jgi:hypothetical protein
MGEHPWHKQRRELRVGPAVEKRQMSLVKGRIRGAYIDYADGQVLEVLNGERGSVCGVSEIMIAPKHLQGEEARPRDEDAHDNEPVAAYMGHVPVRLGPAGSPHTEHPEAKLDHPKLESQRRVQGQVEEKQERNSPTVPPYIYERGGHDGGTYRDIDASVEELLYSR